jgi:hypothetical protein
LSGVLSLFKSSSLSLSLNESLSVLGENELGDLDVGRVDWDLNQSPLFGLSLDLLDVKAPLLSVDSLDLSGGSLIRSSDNGNNIVSSDWEGLDAVFLLELFAEGGRHDGVLNMGWG